MINSSSIGNRCSYSLIGNVLKLLFKSVLISLGLTDQHWQLMQLFIKKILGYGNAALISNGEMNDIKIIKALEEFGLLI